MVPALVVLGPTASGKSNWAHGCLTFLHQRGIEGVIINLDASQFYAELTLGAAKPTFIEQSQFCYVGLNLLSSLHDVWDAQACAQWAHQQCALAWSHRKVPLLVGGSGLYLRAFLHGLDALPSGSLEVRSFLDRCLLAWGADFLHRWLATVDEPRALQLHPNDSTRVRRALEIYLVSGRRASDLSSRRVPLADQALNHGDTAVVGIFPSKDVHQQRIKERIKMMIKEGWLQEVQGIVDGYRRAGLSDEALWALPGLKAIGYRTIGQTLAANHHKLPLDVLVQEGLEQQLITETWQYARKQNNWNKKEKCHLHLTQGVFEPPIHGSFVEQWLQKVALLS